VARELGEDAAEEPATQWPFAARSEHQAGRDHGPPLVRARATATRRRSRSAGACAAPSGAFRPARAHLGCA